MKTGSHSTARNSSRTFGWEAGIRTPIGGSRVRSLTVRRPPNFRDFNLSAAPFVVNKAGTHLRPALSSACQILESMAFAPKALLPASSCIASASPPDVRRWLYHAVKPEGFCPRGTAARRAVKYIVRRGRAVALQQAAKRKRCTKMTLRVKAVLNSTVLKL